MHRVTVPITRALERWQDGEWPRSRVRLDGARDSESLLTGASDETSKGPDHCSQGGSIMWIRLMPMESLVAGLVILGGWATEPSSSEGKAALTRDVGAALAKAKVQDPGLQAFLDKAYGYAIFPSVGKGAVGVGGAYGKGE